MYSGNSMKTSVATVACTGEGARAGGLRDHLCPDCTEPCKPW